MSSIPSTSSAPPPDPSPPPDPPPTTSMASKWFKPDPRRPSIRPLNDTTAVPQSPIPDRDPVEPYVPYIAPPPPAAKPGYIPKRRPSERSTGPIPKGISDKYPDPLAAYLPQRTPVPYTAPPCNLLSNRFVKKAAPALATTTSPAPKPRKLSPVKTPTQSAVREEDEPEEILFDSREPSPIPPPGPPQVTTPANPRKVFVPPNLPDKPVYAIMATIRDRNPTFGSLNQPKPTLKRPHQQWEPRWDTFPRDPQPSSSTKPKSSKKVKSPKKAPPRRPGRSLLECDRTQFMPYDPIDADFDTDFQNFMLRQPRHYESDNFNFDFTRRPMPDDWQPDLSVFDCYAAELDRVRVPSRISGGEDAGGYAMDDDLDSYDARNMFDLPGPSRTSRYDDFEHEPDYNDDFEQSSPPLKKAKKSKKAPESDNQAENENEVAPMGLIDLKLTKKKPPPPQIKDMKFGPPPPFDPESRGIAYSKPFRASNRVAKIAKDSTQNSSIVLPNSCKLFQYTWSNDGRTQTILVPMPSSATDADVEKIMPDILKIPRTAFSIKPEHRNLVLDFPNPNPRPPPPRDPNQPVLVNPKQYNRIVARREMRIRQELNGSLPMHRQDYMYESRHRHAARRKRLGDGRFDATAGGGLSDDEEEEEEEDEEILEDEEDEEDENDNIQEIEPSQRPYLPRIFTKIQPDPSKQAPQKSEKPKKKGYPKPAALWKPSLTKVPLRSVPVPPSGTPLGQDLPLTRFHPSPVVTKIPPMASRSSNRPMAPSSDTGGWWAPRTTFPLRPPLEKPSDDSSTPQSPTSDDTSSVLRAPGAEVTGGGAEVSTSSDLTRGGNPPPGYPASVPILMPRVPSNKDPVLPSPFTKAPQRSVFAKPTSVPSGSINHPGAQGPSNQPTSRLHPTAPGPPGSGASSSSVNPKTPGPSIPRMRLVAAPGAPSPSAMAPQRSVFARPVPPGAPGAPHGASNPIIRHPTTPAPPIRPAGAAPPTTSNPRAPGPPIKASTGSISTSSIPRGTTSVTSNPVPRITTPGASLHRPIPPRVTSSGSAPPRGSLQHRPSSFTPQQPRIVRPQVLYKETGPRLEQRASLMLPVRTVKRPVVATTMTPAQFEQHKAKALEEIRREEEAGKVKAPTEANQGK